MRNILVVAAVAALLCGCGNMPSPNLPPVHKVSGQVVSAAGQPVSGGTIQLQSTSSQHTAIGDVQPDGNFTMRTMVDGVRLDGVVAGAQRATYFPQMTEDQSAAVPVDLKEPIEIRPQDNEIVIKLP
jgi:hypothetical protein